MMFYDGIDVDVDGGTFLQVLQMPCHAILFLLYM